MTEIYILADGRRLEIHRQQPACSVVEVLGSVLREKIRGAYRDCREYIETARRRAAKDIPVAQD